MAKMKVECRPGDRRFREGMKEAHDAGRHGDGTRADVVLYWAGICLDCHARLRYEGLPEPDTAFERWLYRG